MKKYTLATLIKIKVEPEYQIIRISEGVIQGRLDMVSYYSAVGNYVLQDSTKTGKERVWICASTEYAQGADQYGYGKSAEIMYLFENNPYYPEYANRWTLHINRYNGSQ